MTESKYPHQDQQKEIRTNSGTTMWCTRDTMDRAGGHTKTKTLYSKAVHSEEVDTKSTDI